MRAVDHLQILIMALSEPEYLYLLLEPAFIYGVGVGLLVFLSGFFMRDGKAQILGLIAMILSALLIFPYLEFRKKAEPRISKVYQIESPGKVTEFQNHSSIYHDTRWVYLALCAACGGVLLVGARTNKIGVTLSIATAVVAVGVVMFSMAMHFRESQLHHPNLLALKQVGTFEDSSDATRQEARAKALGR